jgi:hypothetical protein
MSQEVILSLGHSNCEIAATFSPDFDGGLFREILSFFFDGEEVFFFGIYCKFNSDHKKGQELLEMPYKHNGPGLIASGFKSLNFEDVKSFVSLEEGSLCVNAL